MQSLNEIYREYAMTVYRYLMSVTHDASLAEELTAETFYQATRTIDRYNETCKLSTWLIGIARNCWHTHLRKNPAQLPIEEADATGAAAESAEDAVFKQESRVDLFRKLHDLPEPFREVMYLRVFGELSFSEVGEMLGRNENWARVTFHRARMKLKERMNDNEI